MNPNDVGKILKAGRWVQLQEEGSLYKFQSAPIFCVSGILSVCFQDLPQL